LENAENLKSLINVVSTTMSFTEFLVVFAVTSLTWMY